MTKNMMPAGEEEKDKGKGLELMGSLRTFGDVYWVSMSFHAGIYGAPCKNLRLLWEYTGSLAERLYGFTSGSWVPVGNYIMVSASGVYGYTCRNLCVPFGNLWVPLREATMYLGRCPPCVLFDETTKTTMAP